MINKLLSVCYIMPSFHFNNSSGRVGGGEISNRDLIFSLKKDADIVIISAVGDGGWNKNNEGIKSFEVASLLEKYLVSRKLSNYTAKLIFSRIAKHKLNNINPDVVVGATMGACIVKNYISSNPSCRGGLIIRAFENFDLPNRRVPLFKKLTQQFIYGNFTEKTLVKLDFLITNSDFMKNKISSLLDYNNIYTIYPTIEYQKRKYNKINKINNIRMISTSASKGFNIFLKLANDFPDIDFYVAGQKYTGPQKVPSNIKMVGWLLDPENFIAAADIFLVPSQIEEAFGRVSVEAIRLGTRVLVSDVGGLPETVLKKSEITLSHNDYELWRSAIDKIIKEPNHLNDVYSEIQRESIIYTTRNQYPKFLKVLKG